MPRESILVTRSAKGVATQYLAPPEAIARYRKALAEPPKGVTGIEVWDSDHGRVRRHSFGKRQVTEDPVKTFADGNKEVIEQQKENQRRMREGLPTVEEEAALGEKQKAIVAEKAKAARERAMTEDDRRKSQGRPSVAEEEAAAAARRREQDAAETAAVRAHENKVRKAQGRPSLEEEDEMITKRRLETLAAKGLAPSTTAEK